MDSSKKKKTVRRGAPVILSEVAKMTYQVTMGTATTNEPNLGPGHCEAKLRKVAGHGCGEARWDMQGEPKTLNQERGSETERVSGACQGMATRLGTYQRLRQPESFVSSGRGTVYHQRCRRQCLHYLLESAGCSDVAKGTPRPPRSTLEAASGAE